MLTDTLFPGVSFASAPPEDFLEVEHALQQMLSRDASLHELARYVLEREAVLLGCVDALEFERDKALDDLKKEKEETSRLANILNGVKDDLRSIITSRDL